MFVTVRRFVKLGGLGLILLSVWGSMARVYADDRDPLTASKLLNPTPIVNCRDLAVRQGLSGSARRSAVQSCIDHKKIDHQQHRAACEQSTAAIVNKIERRRRTAACLALLR